MKCSTACNLLIQNKKYFEDELKQYVALLGMAVNHHHAKQIQDKIDYSEKIINEYEIALNEIDDLKDEVQGDSYDEMEIREVELDKFINEIKEGHSSFRVYITSKKSSIMAMSQ